MTDQIPYICLGHMPILDHLILGMADLRRRQASAASGHLPLELVAVNSWDQMAQGLAEGRLDGACMPLPMALELAASGLEIHIPMLTARGGGRLIFNQGAGITQIKHLQGKSVLVTAEYSISAMVIHQMISATGLGCGFPGSPGIDVTLEVVPPAMMADMLAQDQDGDIGALMAPDPVAQEILAQPGVALACTSSDLWPHHPGHALVVRKAAMDQAPDAWQNLMADLTLGAAALDRASLEERGEWAPEFLCRASRITHSALAAARLEYNPDHLVAQPRELELIQAYFTEHFGPLAAPLNTLVAPHPTGQTPSDI